MKKPSEVSITIKTGYVIKCLEVAERALRVLREGLEDVNDNCCKECGRTLKTIDDKHQVEILKRCPTCQTIEVIPKRGEQHT